LFERVTATRQVHDRAIRSTDGALCLGQAFEVVITDPYPFYQATRTAELAAFGKRLETLRAATTDTAAASDAGAPAATFTPKRRITHLVVAASAADHTHDPHQANHNKSNHASTPIASNQHCRRGTSSQ
jgi:hypothetical protein